jgi:hypothetical protein
VPPPQEKSMSEHFSGSALMYERLYSVSGLHSSMHQTVEPHALRE